MVQLNPSQLRDFIRKKTSNIQIASVVCECELIVVNANVPLSIPNTSYYTQQTKFFITDSYFNFASSISQLRNGSRRVCSNSQAYVHQRTTTCGTILLDNSIEQKNRNYHT